MCDVILPLYVASMSSNTSSVAINMLTIAVINK